MVQAEVPDFMTYKAGGGTKAPSTELAVAVLGGLSLPNKGGDGDGDRGDGGARRRDSEGDGSVGGDGGGVGRRVRLGEQQVSKCLNHGNPQCDARNRRT
jgi:hypothetical protein